MVGNVVRLLLFLHFAACDAGPMDSRGVEPRSKERRESPTWPSLSGNGRPPHRTPECGRPKLFGLTKSGDNCRGLLESLSACVPLRSCEGAASVSRITSSSEEVGDGGGRTLRGLFSTVPGAYWFGVGEEIQGGSKRKAAHRHPLYVHQDPSASLAILLRFSSRYLG